MKKINSLNAERLSEEDKKEMEFFNALEKPTQTLDDTDRNFERNSRCK
jgi:hypothetical protein